MNISIVIESDNLMFSDPARLRRSLELLEDQVRQVPEALRFNAFALSIERPVEVVLIAAGDLGRSGSDQQEIEELLEGPPERGALLEVRRVITSGVRYFDQKNLGVEKAAGELIVFLDSDVVPEEGWLRELLRPLADPSVEVVGGNTYVGFDDLYSRAMALNWFFDLRAAGPVQTRHRFYANNVAFRRATIERFRYETVAGTSRGASVDLASRILAAEIPIHYQPESRVAHPAPNGLRHFVRRAVAQGRDNVLLVRRGGRTRRTWQALWHFQLWIRHSVRVTLRQHRRVDLPVWQIPFALTVAFVYYACALAGGVFTTLFPGWMSRHAQI